MRNKKIRRQLVAMGGALLAGGMLATPAQAQMFPGTVPTWTPTFQYRIWEPTPTSSYDRTPRENAVHEFDADMTLRAKHVNGFIAQLDPSLQGDAKKLFKDGAYLAEFSSEKGLGDGDLHYSMALIVRSAYLALNPDAEIGTYFSDNLPIVQQMETIVPRMYKLDKMTNAEKQRESDVITILAIMIDLVARSEIMPDMRALIRETVLPTGIDVTRVEYDKKKGFVPLS